MCGITGFVDFNHTPKKAILLKMLNQIIYRGPDSQGVYLDDRVGLGINRLSIIDIDNGTQPILNEDKNLVIVFNGEIYNYLELRKELIDKGYKFKTKSDTEVILYLYKEYKEKAAEMLNGMFTFAIWDKINSCLFIARDPMGIKPLYFYKRSGLFIFGSELKTVLSHPEVKKEISEESIRVYTWLGYVGGNTTVFKNIYKLAPGNWVKIVKESIKQRKFYQLKDWQNDSQESLDERLEKVVQRQSISDAPLGVFLSGGVDSSLLAYYLAKNSSKKLNSFSINFKIPSYDESSYSQLVSKQLGTKHHQAFFTEKDLINSFEKITDNLDEPLSDPSLFPTYQVSKMASRSVKVVLSGDGGDEIFGGYPTYQAYLGAELIKKLKIPINFYKNIPVFGANLEKNYPLIEKVNMFLGGFERDSIKRHLNWMSPNLGTMMTGDSILFKQLSLEIRKSGLEGVVRIQLLDLITYLRDNLLVKVDRASMYNSLEVRVPFLDLELVSYALRNNQKHLNFFQTKTQLREIAARIFPREISMRKKKGFGLPLGLWMNGKLKPLVESYIKNRKLFTYYDQDRIKLIWNEHQKGKRNHAKEIWMLVMLSAWLEKWS